MNAVALDERGLLLSCPRCGQRNRMPYQNLGQTFRCGQCRAELHAPGEPVEISSTSQFEALAAKSGLPVLVDFWAPWCGPCKMVAPELAKVAAEGAGHWLVAKVNTEELPELAHRFQITGIPTLVVFSDGREVARQSGALPAAQILQFIEQATLARS